MKTKNNPATHFDAVKSLEKLKTAKAPASTEKRRKTSKTAKAPATGLKTKTAKTSRNVTLRSRSHFIRTYLKEAQLKNVLEKNRSIIYRYAYILHDRDEAVDENGNVKVDENGNVVHKEAHYHIWIKFRDKYSIKYVENLFSGYVDEKKQAVNSHVEITKNDTIALQYLIHKNDVDKYQYEENEVVTLNLDYRSFVEIDVATADDNSASAFAELMAGGWNSRTLLALANKYGKNFIYHYNSYRRLYDDVQHCLQNEREQKAFVMSRLQKLHEDNPADAVVIDALSSQDGCVQMLFNPATGELNYFDTEN